MIYKIISSSDEEFQKSCQFCEENIVLENLKNNGGTLNFTSLTYGSDYLVVAIDGEIVGFNALIFEPTVGFYVNQIAVKNNYKQKGIGSTLIGMGMTLASNISLPICAHVRDYNIASQKMFEKCGFIKEERYSDRENYFYIYSQKEYGQKSINGG